MNIKPYDTTIKSLFLSNFFQIPRFQRPYSWDKGNIDDFWTDVVVSGRSDHFIGSMVFYNSKSGSHLFVVDGQQRLTTITIFLAALRDALTEVGEVNLAKGIQGFVQRPDINAEQRFVLLTESSYPYLQLYIQKHGAPDVNLVPSPEETGISSAYQFAKIQLSAIVATARKNKNTVASQKANIKKQLESVRDALLSLSTIAIELDSEDDAYVVFETLNTRGKDLESKDLIKNLLTKLIPAKAADIDSTKIKWTSLITSLSQSSANLDPSTYLHHFWLSHFDYTAERTLFERAKKYLNKTTAPGFLDQILGDVETYRRIFEPDTFPWQKEETPLRDSLRALGVFKVRQPTPLILSVLRAYLAKGISLKQAKDVLESVERFHFMYTAVAGQSSSGGVSKMYAAAARDLSTLTDLQKRAKHLQEFRLKLKSRLPEEAPFVAGFSELRFSQLETRDRPLIRYILAKIDRSLRTDPSVDYSLLTIEHISPQSPPGGLAPVSNYADIGNLILVSEELNGKLKNKSFSEKKKLLQAANVPLDATLLGAAAWGKVEIAARTAALAKTLHSGGA
jgi:hypothetical protein